jgi:hypothetical protein
MKFVGGRNPPTKSWHLKKSKIRAELTFTLTFALTTPTHRDAALAPASREQGEDEGERRSTHPRPHPVSGLRSSHGCSRYFGLLHPFLRGTGAFISAE